MVSGQAPVEKFEAAIYPTPVYAMKTGLDGTGLILDDQGGFGIVVRGEGFAVALPPAELRRFGAYLFAIADTRESDRDLATMSVMGHA